MLASVRHGLYALVLAGSALAPVAAAAPGDADANGVLDMGDARWVARYAAGEITTLPDVAAADATQDGKVDMEDAFAIATQLTGNSRIVVVAPRYGSADLLQIGQPLRVEVFEKFFPFNITGGTVRIQSLSTGFDSGDQPLTFERDGRALYYHWNTEGLAAASDYHVSVTLTGPGVSSMAANAATGQANPLQPYLTVSLSTRYFEPATLASVVDAAAPTPGIPLTLRRVFSHDSSNYLYVGPYGKGWFHNYDLSLEEYTDGRIAFHGPEGFNRFFTSNGDGRYTGAVGDHGELTRDAGGTFQLREKSGLIYRFRSDLKLNYIRDTNGNQVSATYDSSSRLVNISHSSGLSFTLEYDGASMRIVRLTDHVGRVTNYEYLTLGAVVLSKVTDPVGAITQYTYQTQAGLANGRLLSIQYPDGTFTHYEYSDDARLVRTTGTWGATPTTYSYGSDGATTITDALGGRTSIQVNDRLQPTLVTNTDGSQSASGYDGAGNLIQRTDPLGHANTFRYDEFGNTTLAFNSLGETVQTGYDLRFNKPSWVTDALGQTTSFAYDTRGNLLQAAFADGTHVDYTFDLLGNLVTSQNPAGKITQYTYNGLGQLTGRLDALNHLTQLAYDPAGDLQSVTNAKGAVISLLRDAMGRLTRRTYPDGSHEDYTYDTAGKLTGFTNRRGETTGYRYDNTGRLEWKDYQSGKKYHYQYSPVGDLARVDRVETGTRTLDVEYERDLSRRITKVKVPGRVAPETYDISYAYDAAGRKRFMAYPDGYALNYEYDAADRLVRISNGNGSELVRYEYDGAGRRIKRILGNGTYTIYSYNEVNQMTELVNYSPAGIIQSRFAYDYNENGLRTRMTTLEGRNTYTYDDTNQLVLAQYPDGKSVQYDFDAVGNRTTVTDNGVATSYAANELDQYTQVGGGILGYDKNGNASAQTAGTETLSYDWDEDDRLVGIDRAKTQVRLSYDHQGRLISKTEQGVETRYVWDGIHIAAEIGLEGNLLRRFVYGADVDESLFVSSADVRYWVQSDGQGSAVGTTIEDGALFGIATYDAFGSIRSGSLGPVPMRMAGAWFESSANLYYLRQRWYDPIIGRFVSADHLNLDIGENVYSYSSNDPINFSDPLGLFQFAPRRPVQFVEGVIQTVGGLVVGGTGVLTELWSAGLSTFLTVSGASGVGQGLYNILNSYSATDNSGLNNGVGFESLAMLSTNNGVAHTIGKILDYGVEFASGKWTEKLWYPIGELLGDLPTMFSAGGDTWGSLRDIGALLGPSDLVYGPNPGWGYVWLDTGGGTGGWFFANGGLCPTFVQGGQERNTVVAGDIRANLQAKIKVPWSQSILRSDIPIFGVANGTQFAEYRVEFGPGANPASWRTLVESDKPADTQTDFNDISWMQGDIDIKGNLATWNTGLKEWEHLPWHPAQDSTDLNGLYTLRLTVFGKDGQQTEDRVTVEVGRVIAQVLPGFAVSPDQKVFMRFPEQALTSPFRVFTILPTTEVDEPTPPPCKGCKTLGQVYRIREPGDRFAKDVTLEFHPDGKDLGDWAAGSVGIARFDVDNKEWVWLDTAYTDGPAGAPAFSTVLTALPEPKAIFALMYRSGQAASHAAKPTLSAAAPLVPIRSGILFEDLFEDGLGTFKPRDHVVGALLERDKTVTPDGSYALKLTNENQGGNFSATVLDRSFDVREYGTLSFDYRIERGTKIDFLLKVDGRWYRLRFTGDPQDWRNRDVNIVDLGSVESVLTDGLWHSASVDLRYLFGRKTRQTRIDEIAMGDWRPEGYMKLGFGNNARGAAYWLDNLRITGPGSASPVPAAILVDDFNVVRSTNLVGGATGVFGTPGANVVAVSLDDVPPAGGAATAGKAPPLDRNRALKLDFDMQRVDTYGGYWTSIAGQDLATQSVLVLRLRTEGTVPPLQVGVRDKAGLEGKTLIAPYASAPDAGDWREVRIPLSGLRGLGNPSNSDVLFLTASYANGSGKGRVWVDDLCFERTPYARVADFEGPWDWNLLGGDQTVAGHGAAAIAARAMPDPDKPDNGILRIAYGGSIGKDLGPKGGGFSYGVWESGLGGIDARPFTHLALRMRADQGVAKPNVYLADLMTRKTLRAKDLPEIGEAWQTIRLPLAHYAEKGLDLSRLDALQLVFEWEAQSGTLYLDDIHFEGGVEPSTTAVSRQEVP